MMLLQGKNAIIYGGGPISGAVAQTFAREGAKVFLTGRNQMKLEAIAATIRAHGGQIEAAQVDALDEQAVAAHAAAVEGGVSMIDDERPIRELIQTWLTATKAGGIQGER